MKKDSRLNKVSRSFIAPGLLLLVFFFLWELLVDSLEIPHYILPPPSRIMTVMVLKGGLLFQHALVTLLEVIAGFSIALVVGIGLALLIFYSPIMKRALYPLVIASQTVPVFAIAPLLIVWFGYGMSSKVVMAAIIVFFPIVVNTVDGLKAVDEDTVNMMRVMKATPFQILLKIRVPQALPFIFSGAKIGVAVSLIGAIIGEWVGGKEGLGYLMIHANAQLQIDLIFAAILWLSVLGVSLFGLVSLLEWISFPWRRLSPPK